MYTVSVRRSFVAQHFLTVPDPGPEGDVHSHAFSVAVDFEGPTLNDYGYLVDIDTIDDAMATVIDRYTDTTLNDQPAFEGLNPSVEHFARIFCEKILDVAEPANPDRIRVTMWEDDEAYASYETSIQRGAD